MNLAEAIMALRPDIAGSDLWRVRDDSDGSGQYLDLWHESLGGQPTQAELEAAWIEVRREQREAEIVAEISRRLQALTGAGSNDLAMSLSIVDSYKAYKAGATPTQLDDLEALGDLARQKIYEVRTAADPDSVTLEGSEESP